MMKKIVLLGDVFIIREAFITLLPIVLTINIIVLLAGLSEQLNREGVLDFVIASGAEINSLYAFLLPLFLNISFSSILARSKSIDPISTVLIAMVCFLRGTGFLEVAADSTLSSVHNSILLSMIFTWGAVTLLQYWSRVTAFNLVKSTTEISPRLKSALNLIIPGLLTIVCFEIIGILIQSLFIGIVMPWFLRGFSNNIFSQPGEIQELILYKAVALCSWFLGIHGEKFSAGLFRLLYDFPLGESVVIQLSNIHEVFMNIGGAGSTFVIPFLILGSKRIPYLRSIARLSLPFAFFNVNEILLFGLPIILNPILLIPFFLTPFINMAIALGAIQVGAFSMVPEPIPWMTMPGYSAYVASGGSLWAVITQFLCLLVDGCIYFPFLLLANRQYQSPLNLKKMFVDEQNGFLGDANYIQQDRLFNAQQRATLHDSSLTQKVLKQMRHDRFRVYYQPKVDARTLEVVGFEALLRLQNPQGKISNPTCLPVLYQQGLSKYIDSRVIDIVFDHILHWRSLNLFVPFISINFDKDFLCDLPLVEALIKQSEHHQILFNIEITEQTYSAEMTAIASAVSQLRAAGHRITIDNFGTGYANLRTLIDLDIHEVKLDRDIVVPPYDKASQGKFLLAGAIQLCHSLGLLVVAEGIETRDQLERARACDVDILQGYYLGKPISHQKMGVFLANPAYEAAT